MDCTRRFIYECQAKVREEYVNNFRIDILIDKMFENNISEECEIFLEAYGLFRGCKELTDIIIKKIFESSTGHIIIHNDECKNITHFFKTLYVTLKKGNDNEGAYETFEFPKIIFDNGNEYLEKLNITLYLKKGTKNVKEELRRLLYHELTHAWHDYNSIIHTNKGLYNLAKKEHYKEISKRIENGDVDIVTLIFRALTYNTAASERNAFIAELHADMENANKIFDNVGAAYDHLAKTETFNTYLWVHDNINSLCVNNDIDSNFDDLLDINVNKKLFKLWKEIYTEDKDKTNKQIAKILKQRLNKLNKQIAKNIYKICSNYVKQN